MEKKKILAIPLLALIMGMALAPGAFAALAEHIAQFIGIQMNVESPLSTTWDSTSHGYIDPNTNAVVVNQIYSGEQLETSGQLSNDGPTAIDANFKAVITNTAGDLTDTGDEIDNLEYSLDGGTTWNTLNCAAPNPGDGYLECDASSALSLPASTQTPFDMRLQTNILYQGDLNVDAQLNPTS